jgi:GNAT superfamily N-acetyltransferase
MMSSSSLASLDVGPYRPGEEEAILDCMRVCFNFEPEVERWRHLYLDNPAGKAVIVLARERGRVVSQVAFLPRRIQFFGRPGLVGHSVDAMTRPEWRRKGIKSALSAELRRVAQEHGLMAIFSFANKEHLPIVVKHEGRQAIQPFPVMVRPLKPIGAGIVFAQRWFAPDFAGCQRANHEQAIPDCAAAGPIPDQIGRPSTVLSPASGWSNPLFDERHTRLLSEAEAIPRISMVRDASHLTWRYTNAPGSPYLQQNIFDGQSLQATVVIRTATLFGLRLAFVMEWFWRPEARRESLRLMSEVIRFARSLGVHGVAALAMPGTLQRRLLWRLGFIGVPEFLFPKTNTLNVGPEKEGGEPARWFVSANWYLTWGDGFML